MALKWYEFRQNNSGGFFMTDDKLCHRLIIEAESADDAIEKAEELGCYWDGVSNGIDCPCCGDRWDKYATEIDVKNFIFHPSVYESAHSDPVATWNKKYGMFEVVERPKFKPAYLGRAYSGTIKVNSIAEYAQYMANEYGWTVPDVRIFHHNGNVGEIYSSKPKQGGDN